MRKAKVYLWEGGKYMTPFMLFVFVWFMIPVNYSFTVTSRDGVGERDPTNLSEDELRGMKVNVIDTVLNLSATDEIPLFIQDCGEVAFYRVQVSQTLSGIVLHTISLGRKRKVNVKYVCIKPSENIVTPWLGQQ